MENTEPISDSVASPEAFRHKLGKCEVCAVNWAKYTCPRCELKTCCLNCCNIHKKELNCNGRLDKTKFIRKNKYSNLNMVNDYRFLEDISRNVESYKKTLRFKHSRLNTFLPKHLQKLLEAARSRKTTLKFLPRDFERHKINKSYLNFSTNIIFWRVTLVFANADSLQFCEESVSEMTKVSSLLTKYMVKQDDRVLHHKLKYYRAAGIPKVKVLLKAEEKSGTKFYELDPFSSLKDNLRDRIIIEFPVLHVVLNEHVDSSNIIDSDDENGAVKEKSVTNGRHVIQRILENSEKEELNLDGSNKNLLFTSNENVNN